MGNVVVKRLMMINIGLQALCLVVCLYKIERDLDPHPLSLSLSNIIYMINKYIIFSLNIYIK